MVCNDDDVRQLGAILAVFAHPDDETYTAGGLLATTAKNGQRVLCVTATKGEAGVQDPNKWPTQQLGEIREKELKDSLDILGLKQHQWLGYKDGDCENVNETEAVEKISQIITDFKPDTILTFGPDGMTGHNDHCTVSKWVDKAATKINVYHAVITHDHYDQYFKEADKLMNIFFNTDAPPVVSESECEICFDLSKELCFTKMKALQAMPSQTSGLFEQFDEEFIIKMLEREAFVKS